MKKTLIELKIKIVKYFKNLILLNYIDYDQDKFLAYQKIIKSKKLLNDFYLNNYNFVKNLSKQYQPESKFVEVGAGPSFINEIVKNFVKTDAVKSPNIDIVSNCNNLKLKEASVDIFFCSFVLHHINKVEKFFNSINHALKKDGILILIEPHSSYFGRLIWKYFHHEDFDMGGGGWEMNHKDYEMSNSAIPYIIFSRDLEIFNKKYPKLKIESVTYFSFLNYLASGGLSYKNFLPDILFTPIKILEYLLKPFHKKYTGLFLKIVIKKI